MPRMPIQRGSSPTRRAFSTVAIIPAISASPASRSTYAMITFAAPLVSAWSTAWLEKSWPTAKLCVSIALTTWWPMLRTASPMPPTQHERARGLPAVGPAEARGVDEQQQDQRERDRPRSPTAGSRRSAAKAWWLMNLTSAARGLTRRVDFTRERRREPLQEADGRRAVERRAGDDPAQQVQKAAGERRHGEAARGDRSRVRPARGSRSALGMSRGVYDAHMESGGLGDLFGDPEELQRRLAEFAEQMQGQQRLAWADNAIKLAVDMTVAAVAAREPAGQRRGPGRPDPHGDGPRVPRGRGARARGARGPSVANPPAPVRAARAARPGGGGSSSRGGSSSGESRSSEQHPGALGLALGLA